MSPSSEANLEFSAKKNLQSFLKGAKQVLEDSMNLTRALLSGEEDEGILLVCQPKLQVEFIIEADGWDPWTSQGRSVSEGIHATEPGLGDINSCGKTQAQELK